MSLIKCPDCNKEISDKAEACPQCGYPIKPVNNDRTVSNNESFVRVLLLSIVTLSVYFWIYMFRLIQTIKSSELIDDEYNGIKKARNGLIWAIVLNIFSIVFVSILPETLVLVLLVIISNFIAFILTWRPITKLLNHCYISINLKQDVLKHSNFLINIGIIIISIQSFISFSEHIGFIFVQNYMIWIVIMLLYIILDFILLFIIVKANNMLFEEVKNSMK